MSSPYSILGVDVDADDETIRKRYLELVRLYSPEHHPEKFSAIRDALETIRDLKSRVHYRIFEKGKEDTIESIIEELACQMARSRPSLRTLLNPTQVT